MQALLAGSKTAAKGLNLTPIPQDFGWIYPKPA
jgi:hypothetical protein